MTRTEFEAFLTRTVWRTGDTPFEADLQYLIRMGQARLNRDLVSHRRITRTILTATTYRIPPPDDFHSVRTLTGEHELTYVSPSVFEKKLSRSGPATYRMEYTLTDMIEVMDNRIGLTRPQEYLLSYNARLPEYEDAETWVQEDYFDLFTHACLIHSAPYLREDDRLAVWGALYTEGIESAERDAKARLYSNSPLRPSRPGVVA